MLTKNQDRLTQPQKKALKKTIIYFDNHQHMMHYDVAQERLPDCYRRSRRYLRLSRQRPDGAIRHAMVHQRCSGCLGSARRCENGDWNDFFTYYIDSERDRLFPTVLRESHLTKKLLKPAPVNSNLGSLHSISANVSPVCEPRACRGVAGGQGATAPQRKPLC